MLNLSTIMIGSEDAKALSDFYTKVLGAPSWEDSAYVGWQAGSGMLFIGAHSEVKGRNDIRRAWSRPTQHTRSGCCPERALTEPPRTRAE